MRGLASINAKISVCGHKEGKEGWTVITYELSHLDLRGFLLLTFSIRMEGSVAHEYLLSHNHPSTLPSVMSVVPFRFIQRASVFPQVMGEVGQHENCLDYVSKKDRGFALCAFLLLPSTKKGWRDSPFCILHPLPLLQGLEFSCPAVLQNTCIQKWWYEEEKERGLLDTVVLGDPFSFCGRKSSALYLKRSSLETPFVSPKLWYSSCFKVKDSESKKCKKEK